MLVWFMMGLGCQGPDPGRPEVDSGVAPATAALAGPQACGAHAPELEVVVSERTRFWGRPGPWNIGSLMFEATATIEVSDPAGHLGGGTLWLDLALEDASERLPVELPSAPPCGLHDFTHDVLLWFGRETDEERVPLVVGLWFESRWGQTTPGPVVELLVPPR